MNKVTIPFYGINRSTDQGISQDGECIELINARVANNSIEPVGKPILEQQMPPGRTPVFIHKNSGYAHLITYGSNIIYYEYNKVDGSYARVNEQITSLPDLERVESIGNTLIFVCASGLYYALFKSGSYTFLGTAPQLPVIQFGRTYDYDTGNPSDPARAIVNIPGTYRINNDETSAESTNEADKFRDACTGGISKALALLTENGYLHKVAFIRYALRLFDGSLIMHSGIHVLVPGTIPRIPGVVFEPDWGAYVVASMSGSSADYITVNSSYATAYGYKILSKVKDAKNINLWSDIVQSVDIFVNLQSPFKSDAEKISGSDPERYIYMPAVDNISTLFDDVSNFYFIKSIPVEEIVADTSSGIGDIIEIASSVIENIVQQEPMLADNLSHHKPVGKESYVYNGRLHIGNISNKLFSGFPVSYLTNDTTASEEIKQSKTVVSLKSDNGESTLVAPDLTVYSEGLSPVLIYPDVRAYKMKISTIDGKGLNLSLKKHPFLNLSYHQTPDLYPHWLVTDATATMDTVESNTIEYAPNKIKVSELNNPFVFPAAQTYVVSNGTIMGMRSATMALSTGQYGLFPLYVFTTEGTFALQTGSGDVAYTNILTVSRDCCNNSKGITSTDNAVVFPTDAGLMLMQGNSVVNISTAMNGYLTSSVSSSPVIKKIMDIPNLWSTVSTTEFFHYISNANIGFNYEKKEILVSNASLDYSYVYGISTGQWHKISCRISRFLNSFPECLALMHDGGLYNIHNNHRTVNDIAVITRPVKMGTLAYKRILQSAIRGVTRPALSDLYLRGEEVQFREESLDIFNRSGFYILGSNDAEHFTVIAGRENYTDLRDVITKMNKTKAYKYFIFCLIGGVRTDVAFNYIELLVDESYNNRIR